MTQLWAAIAGPADASIHRWIHVLKVCKLPEMHW